MSYEIQVSVILVLFFPHTATTTNNHTQTFTRTKHPYPPKDTNMRATLLVAVALVAASPTFGQKYHKTCEYISKSDRGAVPDKIKFKCERTGGKPDICTELTLSDCLGVDIQWGKLEVRK